MNKKLNKIFFNFNKFSNCLLISRCLSVHVHPSPQVERIRYVTSFYHQSAVDFATRKSPVRLMPLTMLYSGKSQDKSHLIRSGQYLQREMPVRLAHQISRFRKLPFVVGVHPLILQVHDLYLKSFHKISKVPPINDLESELEYCNKMVEFLEEHRYDISLLVKGLKEGINFVENKKELDLFSEKILTTRIAMEFLCKHYLALQKDSPGSVGIISLDFSPKTVIDNKIQSIKKTCEEKYGYSVEFNVDGQTEGTFPFITQPFGNIMQELLFNAAKATIQSFLKKKIPSLEPIQITMANNEKYFIIRVSDQAGGLHHSKLEKIWNYDLSSHLENFSEDEHHGYLGDDMEFGLPVCRTYARCLGGDVGMESMLGYGSDCYLRLGHIDGQEESFRI